MRPETFDEIIGNAEIIDQLRIIIKSAHSRQETINHVLLSGPRGLGKTTIAYAMAKEVGAEIQIVNGAYLRSINLLLPYLAGIKEGSILFIDEIHRMTELCQEFLYPVMEDFKYSVGNEESVVTLDVPKFTLIGASTDIGRLLLPMIDRFTYKLTLFPYKIQDLKNIILGYCKKIGIDIDQKSAIIIAERSRSTPRIAISNIHWCRDYVVSKNKNFISCIDTENAMLQIGINKKGLTKIDRLYLDALKGFNKPVGLNTLASSTGINKETIEDIIEPYLLQNKIILKTLKGRIINATR